MIVHKMDHNDYSNPNSYPPNDPKIIGTPKQITLFCYFMPFFVSGVFLALLAVGVFDFIPEDSTSKIVIGVFAGIWNFIILLIIIGILITNSAGRKIFKVSNLYESSQPFQSYPNEIDQSSQYQDHLNPQSNGMNFSKKKITGILFMVDFIIAGMLFIPLVIGLFLILYAVGVFDFSPIDLIYKIVMLVFAGFWNFFIFMGLIQIIRSTGLIKLSSDKSNSMDENTR